MSAQRARKLGLGLVGALVCVGVLTLGAVTLFPRSADSETVVVKGDCLQTCEHDYNVCMAHCDAEDQQCLDLCWSARYSCVGLCGHVPLPPSKPHGPHR